MQALSLHVNSTLFPVSQKPVNVLEHNLYSRMVRWLLINWEWREMDLSWPNFWHNPGIYLEGLWKFTINLSEVFSVCPGWQSNPSPPEYKSKELTLEVTCLVIKYKIHWYTSVNSAIPNCTEIYSAVFELFTYARIDRQRDIGGKFSLQK